MAPGLSHLEKLLWALPLVASTGEPIWVAGGFRRLYSDCFEFGCVDDDYPEFISVLSYSNYAFDEGLILFIYFY